MSGSSSSATDDSDDEINETKQAYHTRLVKMWKERSRGVPKSRLRFRTTFHNTILDVLRAKGWKETDDECEWDFLWIERDWIRGVYDRIRLDDHQRVNHYRNFYELTRKDCMVKNLKRAKRNLAKNGQPEEAGQYDFFPETFTLPGEYHLFADNFKRNPESIWIMKPTGKCQGKGIFMFNKLRDVEEWKSDSSSQPVERYVCQRYLAKPLLVGGKKFDLRLYVLTTSYQPLTVYLYREGFGRFSTSRYTMNASNINDSHVHLTNVAVQKRAPDYDKDNGGKMSVRNLKLYLISKHGIARVNQLFCEIQLVIIRSLQSVAATIINDKQSFELYGFDVMIDEDLKVWLIEVNAAPSLTASTKDDYNMKFRLLADMLNVMDMEKKLTGNEEQVGGFDLIYKTGFVKFDHNCTVTSYLGCHNNRNRQLKRLSKQTRKRKEAEAKKEKDRAKTATGV